MDQPPAPGQKLPPFSHSFPCQQAAINVRREALRLPAHNNQKIRFIFEKASPADALFGGRDKLAGIHQELPAFN
jgi:hypothetical protein